MRLVQSKGIYLAVGVAFALHLVLILAIQPSAARELPKAPSPPATRYGEPGVESANQADSVRMLKSPVVFSLPSQMGFSRALSEHDVQTRKMFMQQPNRTEHFLEIASYTRNVVGRIQPEQLMISGSADEPAVPGPSDSMASSYPPARRLTLSDGLRDRLVGGVVLPSSLNKDFDKSWMVRASIYISDQGAVEHVLLDQPLKPESLNAEVVRMLYRLRFKPGEPVDGIVDVYSPEGNAGTGDMK